MTTKCADKSALENLFIGQFAYRCIPRLRYFFTQEIECRISEIFLSKFIQRRIELEFDLYVSLKLVGNYSARSGSEI